jgi:hypothetical protein
MYNLCQEIYYNNLWCVKKVMQHIMMCTYYMLRELYLKIFNEYLYIVREDLI